MEMLEEMIIQDNLLNHKVLLFLLEPGQIDRNIAGLVANKLMAKYQRPCCVLTKVTEKTEEERMREEVIAHATARLKEMEG
jgi:single-stranded DNA-specific DHH superfamily exonuclease